MYLDRLLLTLVKMVFPNRLPVLLVCIIVASVSGSACPPVMIPTDICVIHHSIESLQQRVLRLTADNRQLTSRIRDHDNLLANLTTENDRLKSLAGNHNMLLIQIDTEKRQLEEDLKQVEGETRNNSRLLTQISEDNGQLRNQIRIHDQLIKQLTSEKDDLRKELDLAKSRIETHDQLLKRKHNQVAFSSHHGSPKDYSPLQVIQFPHIIINEGGRFNKDTGKFTCGDSGLYVFQVTVVGGGNPTWFEIAQDGLLKSTGYSGSTTFSSATHAAIVRCRPGSQIWVRREDNQPPNQQVRHHSEFSGFRFGD